MNINIMNHKIEDINLLVSENNNILNFDGKNSNQDFLGNKRSMI